MELDSDKLIALIQTRPPIFNFQMKDHHNRDVLDKLWEDIGKEMNAPVTECRLKWMNLRSSYSRYIREENKIPSGSGGTRKKKWYLADAMSFLRDFTGQHKQMSSNLHINVEIDNDDIGNEREIARDEVCSPDKASDSCNSHSAKNAKQPKQKKLTPSEVLAGPMAEFLKSRTNPYSSALENTSAHLHFFRGILPDIELLSSRRQRTFQMETLKLVHTLLDEQENENIYRSHSGDSSSSFTEVGASPTQFDSTVIHTYQKLQNTQGSQPNRKYSNAHNIQPL